VVQRAWVQAKQIMVASQAVFVPELIQELAQERVA
jgi:hypothetical protein